MLGGTMGLKPFAYKGHQQINNRQEFLAKQEILLIRVGRLMKNNAHGDNRKQKKKSVGSKKRTLYSLDNIEKRVREATDMGQLNRWESKIQNHEDFVALNNNLTASSFFRKMI
jgi:hypothetical protein